MKNKPILFHMYNEYIDIQCIEIDRNLSSGVNKRYKLNGYWDPQFETNVLYGSPYLEIASIDTPAFKNYIFAVFGKYLSYDDLFGKHVVDEYRGIDTHVLRPIVFKDDVENMLMIPRDLKEINALVFTTFIRTIPTGQTYSFKGGTSLESKGIFIRKGNIHFSTNDDSYEAVATGPTHMYISNGLNIRHYNEYPNGFNLEDDGYPLRINNQLPSSLFNIYNMKYSILDINWNRAFYMEDYFPYVNTYGAGKFLIYDYTHDLPINVKKCEDYLSYIYGKGYVKPYGEVGEVVPYEDPIIVITELAKESISAGSVRVYREDQLLDEKLRLMNVLSCNIDFYIHKRDYRDKISALSYDEEEQVEVRNGANVIMDDRIKLMTPDRIPITKTGERINHGTNAFKAVTSFGAKGQPIARVGNSFLGRYFYYDLGSNDVRPRVVKTSLGLTATDDNIIITDRRVTDYYAPVLLNTAMQRAFHQLTETDANIVNHAEEGSILAFNNDGFITSPKKPLVTVSSIYDMMYSINADDYLSFYIDPTMKLVEYSDLFIDGSKWPPLMTYGALPVNIDVPFIIINGRFYSFNVFEWIEDTQVLKPEFMTDIRSIQIPVPTNFIYGSIFKSSIQVQLDHRSSYNHYIFPKIQQNFFNNFEFLENPVIYTNEVTISGLMSKYRGNYDSLVNLLTSDEMQVALNTFTEEQFLEFAEMIKSMYTSIMSKNVMDPGWEDDRIYIPTRRTKEKRADQVRYASNKLLAFSE
jgi:hypothetical protein